MPTTIRRTPSPNSSAAILLRFIDRRPFAEIGAQLRVTEDAARMRVDRALDKLRTLLTRRGLTSTSAALGLVLANNAVAAAPTALATTITTASLVTAPLSVGVGTSILTFMSTTKATLTLAALACLLAASIATRQIAVARSAQSALREGEEQYSALLDRLHHLESQDHATENAGTPPAQVAAGSESAPPKTNDEEDPRITGSEFLSRHSGVKQSLLEYAQAKVLLTWGPFLKTAGLTPDQAHQFVQTMAENSWFGPGAAPGEKPMLLSPRNTLDPNEGEKRLREVLGEELYQKRVEYGRSNPARTFTARIASTLAFSESPLSAGQAAQLVPLIASSKAPKGADRRTNFDWDAIIEKSQGLLSISQLDALEGMRAQDEYQWASSQAAKQARESASETAARATPSP